MSKFCAKCGAELPDEATFCNACGENLGGEAAPAANFADNVMQKGAAVVNKVKGDKKLLGIIAAVLAVVILLVCFWGTIFHGGKDAAIRNYINAVYNGKYKAISKVVPKEVVKYMEDERDAELIDKDDYEDVYEEYLDYLEDEYGKNVKVTFKVKERDKLSEKKLDDIRDEYKERYDIKKKSITAAYEIEVELKFKGKEDKDEDDAEFTVIKIDGKWYLYTSYNQFFTSSNDKSAEDYSDYEDYEDYDYDYNY